MLGQNPENCYSLHSGYYPKSLQGPAWLYVIRPTFNFTDVTFLTSSPYFTTVSALQTSQEPSQATTRALSMNSLPGVCFPQKSTSLPPHLLQVSAQMLSSHEAIHLKHHQSLYPPYLALSFIA